MRTMTKPAAEYMSKTGPEQRKNEGMRNYQTVSEIMYDRAASARGTAEAALAVTIRL